MPGLEPGFVHMLALAAGIVALTFVAEDGATVVAVTLAASQTLDPALAFTACFGGIWLGDLGLYAAARRLRGTLLDHDWTRRFAHPDALARAEQWFQRRGALALVFARFVPGTRLPTYVAAGTLRMPATSFAAVTGICAAAWVGAAFALGSFLGVRSLFRDPAALLAVVATLVVAALAVRGLAPRLVPRAKHLMERLRRWEFWPAWLFYAPVVLMCAWLALRYRGLLLPTVANGSQRNGGVVGESKVGVLRELMRVAPEFTADSYLLAPAAPSARLAELRQLCREHGLTFPFVLKPDIAQRGDGFKLVHDWSDAEAYLAQVQAPVIAQRYAPGPHEAGIFYYRFPGEEQGHILAITEKIFPSIIGDGRSTVEELIRADERARFLAETYLRRLGPLRDRVLPPGHQLRLVEAGNHCQGCIFRDGARLESEELRRAMDAISRRLPGFFIGRYDVRYRDEQELRAGRGFTIVELNGAASEATSIYDARNSLGSAYRMLYRQWKLVYAIGAENRRRGERSAGLAALWNDWRAYQRQAALYPAAD